MNDWRAAAWKWKRARECDAHVGLGLVKACDRNVAACKMEEAC